MSSLNADLLAALPEITLAVGAIVMLMVGVFHKDEDGVGAAGLVFAIGVALLAAIGIFVSQGEGAQVAFNGLFINDAFARFAKVLILFATAIMLILGVHYMRRHQMMKFEYPTLMVLSVVGMCVMVSSNDLITLYMGVELQSLALYVIASFRRDSVRSTEAGLKYFVLGALSSGLLLYGASLIYGFAGSTQFDEIAIALAGDETPLGLLFGLAFLCAGLGFKISAAPFHMWTPDVYEGAPAPVTAFFSTAPKVAAGALFARVMIGPFDEMINDWRQIIAFLAVASMFLGAFAGIAQTNIKRLMAYSSISHMGFALVALTAGGEGGVQAMLIYLAIYVVMNVGVFAFILTLSRDGAQTAQLSDLNGLARTHPMSAAAVTVLMFSLAGVPPLAGFFAKYYALTAAVNAGFSWLAIAGVIASVISAYYYLYIVKRMYFDDPQEQVALQGGVEHRFALGAAALAMLLAVAPVDPLRGFGAPEAALHAAESLVR